jgi:hypothetical protein
MYVVRGIRSKQTVVEEAEEAPALIAQKLSMMVVA